MSEFVYKNKKELKQMQLKLIEEYYLELRKYEYDNNIPISGMEFRKRLHPILLELIKLDRIFSKERISIVSDKRINTDKPKIYACTHIGGNDIQRVFEAIGEHAYLFISDLKELYTDLTGKILDLNGAVCFESNDKTDRHIAYERAIEVLSNGYNLLIFPEGAWNITHNFPVMGLYSGTVRMAIETYANIIPVAIEQYENKFYVNIGKNMSFYDYEDKIYPILNNYHIKEMNEVLREALSTLKWEIWEKANSLSTSSDFSEEYRDNFCQSIVDRCPYDFTIQDVYDAMYKTDSAEYLKKQFKLEKKKVASFK